MLVLRDQSSKTLVINAFQLHHSQPLTTWFNLVRAHNSGTAFSFVAGASGWQRWSFVGLGAVASGFIVWMLKKHPTQTLFCFAVAMIMGGAIGNVIDRLLHGYVADSIQWHYAGWCFPAFNLAASAITLGAICLIPGEILRVRPGRGSSLRSSAPSSPNGLRPVTRWSQPSPMFPLVVVRRINRDALQIRG